MNQGDRRSPSGACERIYRGLSPSCIRRLVKISCQCPQYMILYHPESTRPKAESVTQSRCNTGYPDRGGANGPGGKSFPEPLDHCRGQWTALQIRGPVFHQDQLHNIVPTELRNHLVHIVALLTDKSNLQGIEMISSSVSLSLGRGFMATK